ncbi:MAG: hypothetical protein M1830_006737 [Pleopsidium flavum]|nr:MAG: hypothetical protein M1830_006737 [Pleopsidium flavum]
MRPSTYLMLALSTAIVIVAQPTLRPRDKDEYDWTPALQSYYQAVGKHVANIRETKNFPKLPPCDLTLAVMPPSSLPPPNTGLTLAHVALGRGTQNYTCVGKTPTEAPAPLGALAQLYNATCFAARYPDLLALAPNVALQYPVPTSDKASLPPSNLDISGHHYFIDLTTATFNLDVPSQQQGVVLSGKLAATPAPSGSPLGLDGAGYGSVPWLLLGAKAGTTGKIQQIYRVNTAGGSPPPNCANQGDYFEVQYAAEYWFWS